MDNLKSLTLGALFKALISQCPGTVDQVEACVLRRWVGVEVEVIVFCVLVNIGLDVLGVHMLSCVCGGEATGWVVRTWVVRQITVHRLGVLRGLEAEAC